MILLTESVNATASMDTGMIYYVVSIALIVIGSALIVGGIMVFFHKEHPNDIINIPCGDVSVFAESVIGDRSYQQDFCLFPGNGQDSAVKDAGLLAIVCDGMGGMEGGELASHLCAETIYKAFYQVGRTEEVRCLLTSLVEEADKEVAGLCAPDGRMLNSGTTVVAAVYRDSKIYWVSSGDSRIYLYHNGALQCVTRDHNLRLTLTEQYNSGLISREEFESAKQKEALISYVGKGENLIIDTGEIPFEEDSGDVLILCSDGLYKTASDADIANVIGTTDDASELSKNLVAKALCGGYPGKHDNISVITIKRQ